MSNVNNMVAECVTLLRMSQAMLQSGLIADDVILKNINKIAETMGAAAELIEAQREENNQLRSDLSKIEVNAKN